MELESGYRDWHGRLRPAWWACWPIAWTGVRLVLRRRLFWGLLGLALLNFLFFFATIYLKAQVSIENPMVGRMVDQVLTSVTGAGKTYRDFMFAQGTVTMLVLAFAGELLVGGDYERGGLTFYLSRAVGRRHYVIGKLLAIGLLVAMTTALPALILFMEYGLLTNSLAYFQENWRIVLGILGYGAIMAVSLSLLLFTLASWLNKNVPLVMSWACIFVLLPAIGEILRHTYDDRHWRLLMFWRNLRLLGSWCFGAMTENDTQLAPAAAYIVLAVWIVCVLAVIPRVRAVRVIS
ncbi:MAG: ABC transporter permease [Pirellulaceae bacterium]|nr:ABC transporter permease [Pirellulaceae bacterium]